jgi:glycosyltransferase involved in cell wall biosynthesis
MGEGFGVPIIEAQACGTPVIVTDWTSMPELVGAGWAVDGDPYYRPPSVAFWKVPAIAEIINALEQAYEKRGDQEFRAIARNFALQYDADYVAETYWKPALEALDSPREVPPLRPIGPNRAQRRAQKKAKA